MIVVKLKGGLGNQMFQYACGRAVALHNQTTLKLDLSDYNQRSLRKFLLDDLNVQYSIATKADLGVFGISSNMFKNIFPNMGKTYTPIYKEHKHFDFDTQVFALEPPVYLDGYWQCKDYPDQIKRILHKEFTLKDSTNREYCKLLQQIERHTSVGVHIRRGDLVHNKQTKVAFGYCDIQYYLNAMNYIEQRYIDPTFFVFSDDIPWCKAHIKRKNVFFVEMHNLYVEVSEMMLMSASKHQIISNSTFSWWAAWLNTNRKKIVIAPIPWRKDDIEVKNLLYPTWITLPMN